MNPITREESLLDGQDLTPITRKEQFIKRIYDKTQEVPTPVTREEWFLKKAGEGTSPVTIEQLNATENGTYSEQGKAYSPVIVEVPAPTLITKTITENGTYNASSDNADGYSQVTVNVPYMEKKSASGDIASFSDGAGYPFLKVKANINPVQDLHGYDYPWVGGAGKNKFDVDLPHEEVSGSATYSYTVTVKANTDYTMSCNVPQGSPASLYFNGTATNTNGVWNGAPRTFTSDANGNFVVYIRYNDTQGGIDLYTAVKNGTYYIQLEEGSSATTYAPYSNICPISGWSGANVTRTGKNLFNLADFATTYPSYCSMNDGILSVDSATALYTDGIAFDYPLEGQMFVKCKIKPDTATNSRLLIRYTDGSTEGSDGATGSEWVNITKATSQTKRIKSICLNWTMAGTFEIKDFIISTIDSEYSPYQGSTTSIPFHDNSDNPITVYGGTLNVTSGSCLKYESAINLSSIDSFSSDELNADGYIRYNCTISDKAQGYKIMCDKIRVINNTVREDASSEMISGSASNNKLYFAIDSTRLTGDLSTATGRSQALKTLLQTDDIQVVYELATPQTYNLTPQQINTLIGQNNVWNNTNGQTEVEYFIPIE